ncbi:unnamed protein product, partial [Coregonus sp. 'balchen']
MTFYQMYKAPKLCDAYARPDNSSNPPIPIVGSMVAPWCIKGTYWLCGKNAYYNLPPNWGGTCTVGFVVPAMRVLEETDANERSLFAPRKRRTKRSLAGITHVQTSGSWFLGVLVPLYGVACALDQIRDLVMKIEKMGNATRDALVALNGEVKQFRTLVLQNRKRLTTFWQARVAHVAFNVTHLANCIADTAKRHQGPVGWQLTTWSEGLFEAWGSQIAQWVI